MPPILSVFGGKALLQIKKISIRTTFTNLSTRYRRSIKPYIGSNCDTVQKTHRYFMLIFTASLMSRIAVN